MKIRGFIGLWWCLAAPVLAAETLPRDLERSVAEATHIVVGTASDVAVVSLYNGLLYRLNPQPARLASYTAAQVQLDVQEVLYPNTWKPAGAIKYLFGGGLLPLAEMKSETLNKRMIYLMRAQDDDRIRDNSPVFYAASDTRLAVPLELAPQIRKLIARRRNSVP